MRHASRIIERLAIGPRDLPLVHATLMVVGRDGPTLDWEVVANTIESEPVAHDRHDLVLRVLDGVTDHGRLVMATFSGTAVLVRTVDRTMVFRGDGPLDGFDPAGLINPEAGG